MTGTGSTVPVLHSLQLMCIWYGHYDILHFVARSTASAAAASVIPNNKLFLISDFISDLFQLFHTHTHTQTHTHTHTHRKTSDRS
jgi:hypothetical protein